VEYLNIVNEASQINMFMFKQVELDYDFSLVLAADHDAHSGTCISHLVKELDDVYQNFGGFPRSLSTVNTTLHQLWWSRDQLDFDALGHMISVNIVLISSIRQDPGNIIPYHRDMFHKLRQLYPDSTDTCVRANIFLENSKLGHMLQFTLDGKHRAVTEWTANTGHMFDSSVLHLSCNAGLEPKYTLQLSGFYRNQEQ